MKKLWRLAAATGVRGVFIVTRVCGQIRHRADSSSLQLVFLFLLIRLSAMAQSPEFNAAGVVNGGSYAQPIAPGSIITIFGKNLSGERATAPAAPLPNILAGTSVSVDGIKAPLFFVSPDQINFQAPSSLPTSDSGYTSARIVVSTPQGSSTPVEIPIYPVSPAVFTADSSGCGQAAALNITPDGLVSLNSASNSASPGDYVSLYGTGLGLAGIQPPDGSPAPAAILRVSPGVFINGALAPVIGYGGLAPGLVAVDQINVRIPPGTPEGCAVPVALLTGPLVSPSATISIHSGGGQCIDQTLQSYGQIVLSKTIAAGIAPDEETELLTAAFLSRPGLQPPPSPAAGSRGGPVPTLVPVSRTCRVPGYAQLSAGTIQVRRESTGTTILADPVDEPAGPSYHQSLPNRFISPGQYTISASGGAVSFQGTLPVPVDATIQIQTALGPGTSISFDRPFTIQWKGGTAGTLVKVTLTSVNGLVSTTDYAYADASSGSITFDPLCISGVCSLLLPVSNNAQVTVEVSPPPASAAVLTAQGVTGTITATWTYRYVFGDLRLGM